MYFRVKAKQKKQNHHELKGLLLLVVSFLLGYCFVIPAQAGALGQAVHKLAFLFFGKASYLLPLLTLWFGILHFKHPDEPRWRLEIIVSILLVCVTASFFSISGFLFYKINFGGWLGLKLNPFFRRLFGSYISLALLTGLFAYLSAILLRVSLRKVLSDGWGKLADDYSQWQKAKEELRKNAPVKIKNVQQKPLKQEQPAKTEPKIEPKIVTAPKVAAPPASKTVKPPQQPAQKSPVPAGAEPAAVKYNYNLPPIELLADIKSGQREQSKEDHLANAEMLTKTLADFNITSKVIEIIPGPVVTRYDLELAPGIKVQAVSALGENIALSMKAPSVRVVPIPEKSAVGVEVPNAKSEMVGLKGIVSVPDFTDNKSLLALALGRTTDGQAYVADLMPMPHLLIAGATGSGKSVGIHSVILSILFKARPDEVKFMLIDPKRLEMPIYKGLPHLYDPKVPPEKVSVITQPKEASDSLKKLVKVMERRYEKFAQVAVRNIEGYNEKMAETGGQREFYIVVIIDELADLMLIATKDVEDSIQRLAQMARAVGIHLILATQRPSVDVITGVIKANFPARIAFQTTSKVDSRVIIDSNGAEDLLGRGDMLFIPPGDSRPTRLQGAFVSVKEAEKVVDFIKSQNIQPAYSDFQAHSVSPEKQADSDETAQELADALKLVQERKRVSQDLLKAHFGSSARATNILSLLETKGFIHKPEGTNRWTIYFDKIEEYIASIPHGGHQDGV
ncbi:MAG TPA: cell division protein FtsK [Elusimicrobia bacterium]|nr:MAG: hypothetical protein A2278_03630 [Elusimicrobia bacterium RIFOXYA12_FULL_49_49]OGS11252.1 MAG: hypothetical protein A2386_02010 [Elusimicrobia bacterium RIFOXYB1_FULL_48_9]OGS15649.1 MAG: hypothetical protein A2251_03885 [Elusimicrobia bacterium RIFOXYA2_FULL_47_53]OGS26795.1 MAG: hypothetical protein A2339_07095 [Elusimicrobia bacterium RIFOXYB12_FULL_50_12]OGS30748.1 MAG: hypothetical protein A2323_07690 [Elusimicrobia bacterium RIFOXYB2_FULL_46_23]HBU68946.1 cell division protein Ft